MVMFQGLPPPPLIPWQPTEPIIASYTWASDVPSECSKIVSTGSTKVPCVLGVDEAGRGPVLGPLVYGTAYCPISYQEEMKQIGFADSKALTAEKRDTLLNALIQESDNLGWAVRVMSPQDISAGMLRRRPTNLNAQSSQATVGLIAAVLESGVDVTEIYVDTVGDPKSYSRLLSSHFPRHPHIKWTVTSKADAIYPIVGAASIAAKVTRDRCLEEWQYAEASSSKEAKVLVDATNRGTKRSLSEAEVEKPSETWPHTGSGYPSDPNTVAFLKGAIDPVFGWPGIVRFSWATAKTMLDEKVRVPTSGKGSPRKSSRSSKASALSDEPEFTPTPKAPTLSPLGTRMPTTGTRGYKVKWMDEPVNIAKFFTPAVSAGPAVIPQGAMGEEAKEAARLFRSDAKAIKEGHGKLQSELGLMSCGAGWI